MDRRTFVRAAALAGVGATLPGSLRAGQRPRVRAITRGPKYHWFGYYDKHQFDPSNRYVLGMEVDFEGRSPRAEDVIRIGMVDTADGDRWIELGESRAWGWQQGCMLQWVPGTPSTVIWNDREDDRFVARVLDVSTGQRRALPRPVYALSPDGAFGVGTDFSRLDRMRPGYGYAGVPDRFEGLRAPDELGVYRMNLETGDSELIYSVAAAAQVPFRGGPTTDQWNWFNHLLVSPDAARTIFLHRWRSTLPERGSGGGRFETRLFTVGVDGGDPYVLDPSGYTSHFIWDDPRHITAWTRPEGEPDGFYRFTDRTRQVQPVGAGTMTLNGHNTNLPGHDNRWILNDTYPQGRARMQTLYLYEVPTGRVVVLGHFHSPPRYTGEWRCDLHPRSGRDGRTVCFDSTHGGDGRQMYLVELDGLV